MHRIVLGSFAFALMTVPLNCSLAKDISVTAAQMTSLGIKLAEVRTAQSEAIALLPATVIPAANARIGVPAPFAGTLVQMDALPGQKIKAGDPIARIASRELLEAEGRLSQSEAELQAALAVAERKRALADKKIWSPTLAAEAEAQVEKIRAVVTQHKAAISIGGIERLGGGRYVIRAPADGKVAETLFEIGQPISAMAAAVTIDTSSQLWLEAQVPGALAERIKAGDDVAIEGGQKSRIISIGHTLDKLTHSVRLIAEVARGSHLLPGQMVTITISRAAVTGMLEVPANAVTWIGGGYAVFARIKSGFSLRAVDLRGKSLTVATIVGRLAPGEMVAESGLPELEAILNAH
ncbi:MAG: efflux RND transporter periplasmic adaptor subunit [Hyphomicrobiaceae bacterium]